jgi:hypothetical protein
VTRFSENLLTIKCVFIFSVQFFFSERLLILKPGRHVIMYVHTCLCKAFIILITFILVRFNKTLIFLDIVSKISSIKFHQTPSCETRVFHAERWTDGQTDRRTDRRKSLIKLIFAFRNSADAHKITS